MHNMQDIEDYRGFCIRQILSPHPPACRHIINNISRYNIRQISTIILHVPPSIQNIRRCINSTDYIVYQSLKPTDYTQSRKSDFILIL